MNQKNTESAVAKPNKSYAFMLAFAAAVGGFLFGYDLVIIGGAQIYLKEQFALDENAFGYACSSAVLGCLIGPFCGMWLCDWISRKRTLVIAAILFGISAAGSAWPEPLAGVVNGILGIPVLSIFFGLVGLDQSEIVNSFNVFRIVGGVGVGLASVAAPMYISEIAPARMRGALGLMYQMAICIGAAISVVVAYFLADDLNTGTSNCWRWMFASELVPIVCFLGFLSTIPKSPRWLSEKGKYDEALGVLSKLDGSEAAQLEMNKIQESLGEETGSFGELLRPGVRFALLIGIFLALFNNWTGWSGIAYYQPTIFKKAGYGDPSQAILMTMLVMIVNIFWTALAIWLVDRSGRRPLWNWTCAAMFFAMTLAGIAFFFNASGIVILLIFFIAAAPHAIGIGPLPWLMMSEIQPTRIRAKAVAISTTFLWFAGWSGPRFFPVIAAKSEALLGSIAGVFWMYAIVCVLALVFGLFWLPETKGKTLEDIAGMWLKKED